MGNQPVCQGRPRGREETPLPSATPKSAWPRLLPHYAPFQAPPPVLPQALLYPRRNQAYPSQWKGLPQGRRGILVPTRMGGRRGGSRMEACGCQEGEILPPPRQFVPARNEPGGPEGPNSLYRPLRFGGGSSVLKGPSSINEMALSADFRHVRCSHPRKAPLPRFTAGWTQSSPSLSRPFAHRANALNAQLDSGVCSPPERPGGAALHGFAGRKGLPSFRALTASPHFMGLARWSPPPPLSSNLPFQQ